VTVISAVSIFVLQVSAGSEEYKDSEGFENKREARERETGGHGGFVEMKTDVRDRLSGIFIGSENGNHF